ncbi:SODIUM/HYDROGEN EXCHANGER 7 [Salix koriyanagi]|uniref:SODIUM/HYDROGEN EXCHANGER 7 n=1 Tax=Salix koriyanagi TaxID=2511006 RepID=A0A9Q0UYD1_9ROSI|nr:SODIUM/HYDROGEN EXCHANGER 7 [Salix koriyanagi]
MHAIAGFCNLKFRYLSLPMRSELKRLLRNPPLVEVPKITNLIHPLLEALPSMVRRALEGSAEGIIKPCGVPLYKKDSYPNGVWLISNGVVKWTSNSIRSTHSLHPTFTHGSTLGLEKILSVLESDPAVEDFLWKESAIILAKLLLPRVFENMLMEELRVLVAERSVIIVYMRGKTIKVSHDSIGFLLEGLINAHGSQEESIASPAVLLPLQGDQSSQNMEISVTGTQTDEDILLVEPSKKFPIFFSFGFFGKLETYHGSNTGLAQ